MAITVTNQTGQDYWFGPAAAPARHTTPTNATPHPVQPAPARHNATLRAAPAGTALAGRPVRQLAGVDPARKPCGGLTSPPSPRAYPSATPAQIAHEHGGLIAALARAHDPNRNTPATTRTRHSTGIFGALEEAVKIGHLAIDAVAQLLYGHTHYRPASSAHPTTSAAQMAHRHGGGPTDDTLEAFMKSVGANHDQAVAIRDAYEHARDMMDLLHPEDKLSQIAGKLPSQAGRVGPGEGYGGLGGGEPLLRGDIGPDIVNASDSLAPVKRPRS